MAISVMTPADDAEEDKRSSACRCCGRISLLLLAGSSIACSILTILSCDFFRLVDTSDAGALNLTGASSVGIFSYATQSRDGFVGSEACQAYASNGGNMFRPSDWMGTMWTIAQYAALIAPCLATCATLVTMSELFFGKFCGSFLIPSLLYILAFATQGFTFFMYNEEEVCFPLDASDTNELIRNSCQLSFAAFLSMAAGFIYYVCAVLLCCLPRPSYHCCTRKYLRRRTSNGNYGAGISSDGHKGTNTSLEEESSEELDMEAPTVSGATRSTTSLSQQQ